MANTGRGPEKREEQAADHPSWDRKQGTPKDQQAAKTVERASSRYSASEQSEEKSEQSGDKKGRGPG